MLHLARRGSASLASTLFSTAILSRCTKVVQPRTVPHFYPHVTASLAARSFGSSPRCSHKAAASAAVEEEVAQEGGAVEDAATSHGPVTKFRDLATRGMVCQTIVNTITKGMGLETMTEVQSKTINETLKGIDV